MDTVNVNIYVMIVLFAVLRFVVHGTGLIDTYVTVPKYLASCPLDAIQFNKTVLNQIISLEESHECKRHYVIRIEEIVLQLVQ